MEEIELYIQEAKDQMEKAVLHTQQELLKIRAGKAMPNMLDGIMVEYYGSVTPINQVAAISTPDARSILIKPWEKSSLSNVERAIINSDLGLNPQNDGETIRLNIPPLTEDRRKELVKQSKGEIENGRVRLRRVRQETNDALKSLQKDGASEDLIKDAESKVQKLTDSSNKTLDTIFSKKEAEILTI